MMISQIGPAQVNQSTRTTLIQIWEPGSGSGPQNYQYAPLEEPRGVASSTLAAHRDVLDGLASELAARETLRSAPSSMRP